MSSLRIAVVGCGGIGGTLAASLSAAGQHVTIFTRNNTVCEAVSRHGLGVVERGSVRYVKLKGEIYPTISDADSCFDLILLATQPTDVESAAREFHPLLKDTGAFVCLQNGLCESRVARQVGDGSCVVGAVVTWGATMVRPGVVSRTSSGGFVLGGVQATDDARIDALAELLGCVGPVTRTENLLGIRWSKLAINCAISSLGTVGGDYLGPLSRKCYVRRLALDVIREVVTVAEKEGVRLERIPGTIDLRSFVSSSNRRTQRLAIVKRHALLVAMGLRYRRLRSSMLYAIERGRPPSVDFLNGEVVTAAQRHGCGVPVNRALVDAIWSIAQGKSRASHETLRDVYKATRTSINYTNYTI